MTKRDEIGIQLIERHPRWKRDPHVIQRKS